MTTPSSAARVETCTIGLKPKPKPVCALEHAHTRRNNNDLTTHVMFVQCSEQKEAAVKQPRRGSTLPALGKKAS
jgi:hypothetical protein